MCRGQGRRDAWLIIVRSLTNLAVSELLGEVDFTYIGGGDVLHDPTVLGCRIGAAQNTDSPW